MSVIMAIIVLLLKAFKVYHQNYRRRRRRRHQPTRAHRRRGGAAITIIENEKKGKCLSAEIFICIYLYRYLFHIFSASQLHHRRHRRTQAHRSEARTKTCVFTPARQQTAGRPEGHTHARTHARTHSLSLSLSLTHTHTHAGEHSPGTSTHKLACLPETVVLRWG